eukprot:gene11132-14148_t
MSDRGMMLAADVPISVGERLEIALSDTVTLVGNVVWSNEGRCGVAFDTAVDVADVLKQLAQKRYTEVSEAFRNTVYEQSDSLKPAAENASRRRVRSRPLATLGGVLIGIALTGILSHATGLRLTMVGTFSFGLSLASAVMMLLFAVTVLVEAWRQERIHPALPFAVLAVMLLVSVAIFSAFNHEERSEEGRAVTRNFEVVAA